MRIDCICHFGGVFARIMANFWSFFPYLPKSLGNLRKAVATRSVTGFSYSTMTAEQIRDKNREPAIG
ncbi:hypothetical protein IMCC21224_113523 [Puniceibacterium sp. IMCC21224]|nr:hypothetical protein IMCC21224_113523 [Puniceibacterium sp. IMCC21224]